MAKLGACVESEGVRFAGLRVSLKAPGFDAVERMNSGGWGGPFRITITGGAWAGVSAVRKGRQGKRVPYRSCGNNLDLKAKFSLLKTYSPGNS